MANEKLQISQEQKLHKTGKSFTIVYNETLRIIDDPVALAIFVYLVGKPDGWIIRHKDLMNRFSLSKNTIYKRLKILKELGLYDNYPVKDETGKILYWKAVINQEPTQIPKNENLENPESGELRNIVNKEILKNKEITGTGSGSSSMTDAEKEAMKLLRKKLDDNRISLKQVREVLKLHTCKEATLEWSIDNYLRELQGNETAANPIRKKFPVFLSRLKKNGKGYYPDTQAYTQSTHKKAAKPQQEAPKAAERREFLLAYNEARNSAERAHTLTQSLEAFTFPSPFGWAVANAYDVEALGIKKVDEADAKKE